MKYECYFHGRKAGAIGILHNIYTTVKARDKGHARTKLYEKYEHISYLKIGVKEDDDSE